MGRGLVTGINSYSSNKNSYYFPQNDNGKVNSADKLKQNIRDLSKDNSGSIEYKGSTSILDSMKQYRQTMQAQRMKSSDTSLQVKKIKYQFKNLSAKILRCKTSVAAKQVAGQASREVIRLKNQKQINGTDNEELDAAITHAKAMERIAKKKANHLLEEELARASDSICEDNFNEEELEEALYREDVEEAQTQEEYNYEEIPVDEVEIYEDVISVEMLEELAELGETMEGFDESSIELYEEMSQVMQDMLEDMGLEELVDSVHSVKKDMDPEDLKMLKIKHRNKEMKDLVKADMQYLKAIFEQYEKEKSSGVMPVTATSPSVSFAMPSVPESTIDVTL